MESDNLFGRPYTSLYTPERLEILEQTYANLTTLVCTYCPNLDPGQVDAYLRNIDFSHLEQPEKEIMKHLLTELTASIPPLETTSANEVAETFTDNLSQAEVHAGGLRFLDEEGLPVSDEHLKNKAAGLRASILFTRSCDIDCENILRGEIPAAIAKMIARTGGHRIPASLQRQVPPEMLHLYGFDFAPEDQNPDIDDMIEQDMREMKMSPEVFRDRPEIVQEIRNAIRNALWKARTIKDKAISDHNRRKFIAIKRFLNKYPDLSALIPWLMGKSA